MLPGGSSIWNPVGEGWMNVLHRQATHLETPEAGTLETHCHKVGALHRGVPRRDGHLLLGHSGDHRELRAYPTMKA